MPTHPPNRPEADQVLVAVNPKAGRRPVDQQVERFLTLLRASPCQATVLTDLDQIAAKANQWHAEGRLRALVGVGGDGTAAELVNRTQTGVPITLLAAGTGNVLAKHFGLPDRAEKLLATVVAGHTMHVDAGRASGRVFLAMLGCGFDAEVVRGVHARRAAKGGGHITYASYLKPVLESIRSYHYPELRVYCEEQGASVAGDQPPWVTGRWVFVCNLPRYGWGVRLAPKADPTDGLLDLCTFRRGSFWHGLRLLAAAQCGGLGGLADFSTRQVRRVTIVADEPVGYQLDGDPGGHLPVEIESLPGRVTLVVPPTPEPLLYR